MKMQRESSPTTSQIKLSDFDTSVSQEIAMKHVWLLPIRQYRREFQNNNESDTTFQIITKPLLWGRHQMKITLCCTADRQHITVTINIIGEGANRVQFQSVQMHMPDKRRENEEFLNKVRIITKSSTFSATVNNPHRFHEYNRYQLDNDFIHMIFLVKFTHDFTVPPIYKLDGDNTDCVLVIRSSGAPDLQYKAHRRILAENSKLFEQVIEKGLGHKKFVVTESHNIFREMIDYWYDVKPEGFTNVEAMCDLAAKYGSVLLMQKCEAILVNQLTIRNVLRLYRLGEKHHLTKLEKEAYKILRYGDFYINLSTQPEFLAHCTWNLFLEAMMKTYIMHFSVAENNEIKPPNMNRYNRGPVGPDYPQKSIPLRPRGLSGIAMTESEDNLKKSSPKIIDRLISHWSNCFLPKKKVDTRNIEESDPGSTSVEEF